MLLLGGGLVWFHNQDQSNKFKLGSGVEKARLPVILPWLPLNKIGSSLGAWDIRLLELVVRPKSGPRTTWFHTVSGF